MSIPTLEERLRRRDAQIKEQAARIKRLEREIDKLKKLLVENANSKESKSPKEATNFNVARHERKQRKKRRRRKSTGRKPKDVKRDRITQAIDLYWCGADRKNCVLRREQFVWRLIDGKAEYVHYRMFFLRKAITLSLRNPDNRQYKRFLKSLFAIYYDAVRFRRDRRLSAGRQAKVNKLQSVGNVLSEINRWIETGQSIFREELATLQEATAVLSNSPP